MEYNIVQKLWGLCDILRDDGITYHQYVNELTYLLFLKMTQETKTESKIPSGWRWSDLVKIEDATEQFNFYLKMLAELGTKGVEPVKTIFANPNTLIQHPESIKLLVKGIDSLDWYNAKKEGFGEIYEGILQKNATEKRSGAGQYFTPRPLIECIVNVIKPQPCEIIQDPAAGTCGFVIIADDYIKKANTNRKSKKAGATKFYAVELNKDTHRLALMNTMLHDINCEVIHGDTLSSVGAELPNADLILTNPPFGSKKGAGRTARNDFPFATSNKQLAFLQHIYLNLKSGGRAAVVLPDNVLFEENIGNDIRVDLMNKCNLHTILRLPTGIFYAPGVKTNVLFFTKGKSDKNNTKSVWFYDMRANMPQFGQRTPLKQENFYDFIKCYGDDPNGLSKRKQSDSKQGRWKEFSIKDIRDIGYKLDSFRWIEDNSNGKAIDYADPIELAGEVIVELEGAIEELALIIQELETNREEEVA
jgi:type I restriction enzyme M protein